MSANTTITTLILLMDSYYDATFSKKIYILILPEREYSKSNRHQEVIQISDTSQKDQSLETYNVSVNLPHGHG